MPPRVRAFPWRAAHGVVRFRHLAENFAALPLRRGQKQDHRLRLEKGGVQGQRADDCGFAGLARTIEQDLALAR